jgi:hypothetical protein
LFGNISISCHISFLIGLAPLSFGEGLGVRSYKPTERKADSN